MSLILSPNQTTRGQNSLVEDSFGDNQFERLVKGKREEILDIQDRIDTLSKKDDFHYAMFNYTIRVSESYWDFLSDIYGFVYDVLQYNNNASSFPILPLETVNEKLLTSTNFSLKDLTVLDPLSYGATYLSSLSTSLVNSSFDSNWYPFNYDSGSGSIDIISAAPFEGSYFTNSFSSVETYTLQSSGTTPVPPAPSIITITWVEPLEVFGIIIGSVETLNNYNFTPSTISQKATLEVELLTAFNLLDLSTITAKIQLTINELTEPEYLQNKTDLESLRDFILSITQADLLTDHLNWKAQLDSIIPLILNGYRRFMDDTYIFFETRMSRSGGYLPSMESDLDRILEVLNEIEKLEKLKTFIETHIDPLP